MKSHKSEPPSQSIVDLNFVLISSTTVVMPNCNGPAFPLDSAVTCRLEGNTLLGNISVTFYHLLKLFQTEYTLASGKKQLVSQFYDGINVTRIFGE